MVGLREPVDSKVTEGVHRSTSSGEYRVGDGRELGNPCRVLVTRPTCHPLSLVFFLPLGWTLLSLHFGLNVSIYLSLHQVDIAKGLSAIA